MFDEQDVADNLPKAEAAARKLRAINSAVTVEPVVTDIDHTNILDLVSEADQILDGTDNFETRYLINLTQRSSSASPGSSAASSTARARR